jgi:hypothetical protein
LVARKSVSTGPKSGPLHLFRGPRSGSAVRRVSSTRPFKVAKPVQLQINGQPPAGLQDGSGRLIDGDHNGTPGGNAVAILSRGGASIEAITPGTPSGPNVGIMVIVDALFEQDAFAELTAAIRPGRGRAAAAW